MSRHRRSVEAQQRRYINRLVSTNSYKDYSKQENINILSPEQLECRLVEKFGDVRTGIHLQFAKGEVTSDPYGRGSLQRMIDNEE